MPYYVSRKATIECYVEILLIQPGAVSAGQNLTFVGLAANAFNGSLDTVCSSNVIQNLTILDLGLNKFTGIWAGLLVV